MFTTLLVVSALLVCEPQVSIDDIEYLPEVDNIVSHWGNAQIAESQLKILIQLSPSRTHLLMPQVTEARRQQAFWSACYYCRINLHSLRNCKASEVELLNYYHYECISHLNQIRKLVGDEDYFAHNW